MLPHEVLAVVILAMGVAFHHIIEFAPGSGLDTMKQDFRKSHQIPATAPLVPIGIHGDGVALHKRMSMEVISFDICSAPKSKKYCFSVVEKQDLCDCGCGGRCTLDAMLEIFRWSLMVLYTGNTPQQRHDGTAWLPSDKSRCSDSSPLTFRGCLLQSRGDWPWFKWLFGFKGWNSPDYVCWRCRANSSTIPYWDASPGAKWHKHRHTEGRFAALIRENCQQMSPLFSIPGFTMMNICIDMLHAVDLGIAQEIVGNVFFEALGSFAPGKNRKLQLDELVVRMKDHYSRMRTRNRMTHLTMDMVRRDGKAPRLRAKGAETKHIVPFALEIATAQYAANEDDHAMNVLQCVSGLLDFYMASGLRPYPWKLAQDACRTVSTAYVKLHAEADANDVLAWRIKPKLHIFMELGLYQTSELGDPESYWAYADEDHMGTVHQLTASRGGPSGPASAAVRVIERSRVLASRG